MLVPGLLTAIRARSRRFSRAALVVYLALLTLLAFGHRCQHDLHLAAGPQETPRCADQGGPAGHPAPVHADCLACSLQRDGAGLAPELVVVDAPLLQAGALLFLPEPATAAGAPLRLSSRGPPLS